MSGQNIGPVWNEPVDLALQRLLQSSHGFSFCAVGLVLHCPSREIRVGLHALVRCVFVSE